MKPDDYVLVNEGKRADLALAVFSDVFDKKESNIILNLIRSFDEGETDPKPYLALVGKLSCYREIRAELDRLVKKGRAASEREYKNGT